MQGEKRTQDKAHVGENDGPLTAERLTGRGHKSPAEVTFRPKLQGKQGVRYLTHPFQRSGGEISDLSLFVSCCGRCTQPLDG
jgi:hypothetical protein